MSYNNKQAIILKLQNLRERYKLEPEKRENILLQAKCLQLGLDYIEKNKNYIDKQFEAAKQIFIN